MSLLPLDFGANHQQDADADWNLSGSRSILTLTVPNIAFWVIVWMSFFNLATLDVEKEGVGLDGQVLAKLTGLAIAGLVGAWGWLESAKMRKLCSSGWMLGLSIFVGIYFVTGLLGIDRVTSTVSNASLLAVVLVTCYSVVENGWYRTYYAAFGGVLLYCVCSILYWMVSPESAMFAEALPEGEFAMRLRGLSHPNTLGQYSGLTIATTLVLWINRKIPHWLAVVSLSMGVACLAGSLSRASMLATAFCLFFVYRKWFLSARWILPLSLLVGLVCFAGVIFSEQIDIDRQIEKVAEKLSKSGDAEELTSATGRADIWAKTLELVAARPLLGYGSNTSKDLLVDYSSYTHNMYLNTALSGGVICFGLTAWLALGRLLQCFRVPNLYSDLVLVFILVNGMVENVIYAPLPAAMTIFWILALTSSTEVVRHDRIRELPELN